MCVCVSVRECVRACACKYMFVISYVLRRMCQAVPSHVLFVCMCLDFASSTKSAHLTKTDLLFFSYGKHRIFCKALCACMVSKCCGRCAKQRHNCIYSCACA